MITTDALKYLPQMELAVLGFSDIGKVVRWRPELCLINDKLSWGFRIGALN
jgi:hypothetical protein